MNQDLPLTEDQLKRIEKTLARIRAGLKAPAGSPFEEPAHLFAPENTNDKTG